MVVDSAEEWTLNKAMIKYKMRQTETIIQRTRNVVGVLVDSVALTRKSNGG